VETTPPTNLYLTISNFDGGGVEDVDGNPLNVDGTYALEYTSCLSYEFIGGTECDDPGDYLYAQVPAMDPNVLDILMPIALLGFRDTFVDGTLVTQHTCPPGITAQYGRYDIVAITPDDILATAFREFLCGAPASLSGSVTGDWQGEPGLQFSFDWELTL